MRQSLMFFVKGSSTLGITLFVFQLWAWAEEPHAGAPALAPVSPTPHEIPVVALPSGGMPGPSAYITDTMRSNRLALAEAQKQLILKKEELQKRKPECEAIAREIRDLSERAVTLQKQLEDLLAQDPEVVELQRKVDEWMEIVNRDREAMMRRIQEDRVRRRSAAPPSEASAPPAPPSIEGP